MGVIDVGAGPALVLVPGVQGRWEWMAPAVQALSRRFRVVSFSLDDLQAPPEPGFDGWMRLIDRALERSRLGRVILTGVSFGGLVALHYAASRRDRVSALVLVSTPSPRWRLDRWSARYVRQPTLALPAFFLRGCWRLAPEIVAARHTWPSRARLAADYAVRVFRSPVSPRRMAAWARAWMATDFLLDCGRIDVPVLLVTGEPRLDRVVPVSSTLDYLSLIPQARHVQLAGTGHVGLITKPDEFSTVIGDFVEHAGRSPAEGGAMGEWPA
jgi:pimeloyl-ACP methyl ester carboxylesterase